jgi:hypothetical protein
MAGCEAPLRRELGVWSADGLFCSRRDIAASAGGRRAPICLKRNTSLPVVLDLFSNSHLFLTERERPLSYINLNYSPVISNGTANAIG